MQVDARPYSLFHRVAIVLAGVLTGVYSNDRTIRQRVKLLVFVGYRMIRQAWEKSFPGELDAKRSGHGSILNPPDPIFPDD